MGVWDSKFWNIFDARYKKAIWIILIVLIQVAIGITVPRLFLKGPKTRATLMSLGMGAKSLGFIAYEVSTEYVKKLQRWRSYKANTILNGLDILFWGAVAFLNLQANINSCPGVSCYLGWALVGIAVVVNQIYIFATIMCWREWKGLTGGHHHQAQHHQEAGFTKTSSNSSSIPMYAAKTAYEAAAHHEPKPDDQQRLVQAQMNGRGRSLEVPRYSQGGYTRHDSRGVEIERSDYRSSRR